MRPPSRRARSLPCGGTASVCPAGAPSPRPTRRDVRAVLHRIGSNVLAGLPPGRARGTLFCDFRGRLLHRAVVAALADGAVWLLRDDAPAEPLATFVERHVFREDVSIED